MKAKLVTTKPTFKPITIELTFDDESEFQALRNTIQNCSEGDYHTPVRLDDFCATILSVLQ